MEFDYNVLVNYGALGICLGYFIYKDMKLNKDLKDAQDKNSSETNKILMELKEVITVVKEIIKK